MDWITVSVWITILDPRGRMSIVQSEIMRSALARGDLKRAKQLVIDWKLYP